LNEKIEKLNKVKLNIKLNMAFENFQDNKVNVRILNAFDRLGSYFRTFDEGKCSNDLTFEEIYQLWETLGYFKNISEKGTLFVSYDNKKLFIPFVPQNGNRHQLISLSSYIDSIYHIKSKVKIYCRHENDGLFEAIFSGDGYNYQYVNDKGGIIYFKFE